MVKRGFAVKDFPTVPRWTNCSPAKVQSPVDHLGENLKKVSGVLSSSISATVIYIKLARLNLDELHFELVP
jgi:hypothetical protein